MSFEQSYVPVVGVLRLSCSDEVLVCSLDVTPAVTIVVSTVTVSILKQSQEEMDNYVHYNSYCVRSYVPVVDEVKPGVAEGAFSSRSAATFEPRVYFA